MSTSREAQIALIEAIKADAPIQIVLALEHTKTQLLRREGGPHEIHVLPEAYRKILISMPTPGRGVACAASLAGALQ